MFKSAQECKLDIIPHHRNATNAEKEAHTFTPSAFLAPRPTQPSPPRPPSPPPGDLTGTGAYTPVSDDQVAIICGCDGSTPTPGAISDPGGVITLPPDGEGGTPSPAAGAAGAGAAGTNGAPGSLGPSARRSLPASVAAALAAAVAAAVLPGMMIAEGIVR